jgi:hypothetical protein
MNLKEFIENNPNSDPLSIPLGYNEEGELISFNLAHHSSLVNIGHNYELAQSILTYSFFKNNSDDFKVIYYESLGRFCNMPQVISYNEGYKSKLIRSIQWAVNEIEKRKKTGNNQPRILLALVEPDVLFGLTADQGEKPQGQLLDMLKYISMFGARYGINLIMDGVFHWKEENDKFLSAFDAWVTLGGTFEDSQYLTGNRYTFRDLGGKAYYKLWGEKAEILEPITANDFITTDLLPGIDTIKSHDYNKEITNTEVEGPITEEFWWKNDL